MAHIALYREWRPLTFDEVVEQQHAVIALRQAVLTGQIAHAYLFSGTRGTGKTTLAKVFSRAINCLDPQNGNPCNRCSICTGILNGSLLDVVEMDAASNNSVDTIRRICDEVVFMPSQARFKVYIIDEVHMLSTGAFNALLKTLEEPPAHAVFILATTEPHRIPATILSRCQRYEFRRIPLTGLVGRLREIADKDGISVDESAIDTIARLAEGGMRDAISLLDQVRMTSSREHVISRDDVLRMTGVADDDLLAQTAQAILSADATAIIRSIEQLIMAGRDLARFLLDLAAFCRNILVVKVTPDPLTLLQITQDQLARLGVLAQESDSAALITLVRSLSALHGDLRWSTDTRITLEIGLIRIMGELNARSEPVTAKPSTAPLRAVAKSPQPVVAPVPSEKKPDTAQPVPEKPQARLAQPDPVPAPSGEDEPQEPFQYEPTDIPLSQPPEAPLPEPPDEPVSVVKQPVRTQKPPAAASAFPFEAAGLPTGADPEDSARWKAIQNQLLQDGQMTLYLFSRPASVSFCGGELHLIFDEKDSVNCHELGESQNIQLLRSAATRIMGTDTRVVVRLSGQPQLEAQNCPVPDEPAWIARVREAADAFHIPIKMEEQENG